MDKLTVAKTLQSAQEELVKALQQKGQVDLAAEEAQQAYDTMLSEIFAESSEAATIADTLEECLVRKSFLKKEIVQTKKDVRATLEETFFGADELPKGFSQKRKIHISYIQKDMLYAALKHFPHLLTLDDKKVQKFFSTYTSANSDGYLIISDDVLDFVDVSASYVPMPQISEPTLLKVDVDGKDEV